LRVRVIVESGVRVDSERVYGLGLELWVTHTPRRVHRGEFVKLWRGRGMKMSSERDLGVGFWCRVAMIPRRVRDIVGEKEEWELILKGIIPTGARVAPVAMTHSVRDSQMTFVKFVMFS